VDQWFLDCIVHDAATGEHVSEGFWTVQNPLQDSHLATLGQSTAQASYDLAWWDTNGTFLIESTQTAEGVPTSLLFTTAAGYIYLTPSADLTLTIDASWTYDLPVDWMEADVFV